MGAGAPIVIGLCIGAVFFGPGAIVGLFLTRYGLDSPFGDWLLWGLISSFLMGVATLIIFASSQASGRPLMGPALCINLALCLGTGGILWHFRGDEKDADYIYLSADLGTWNATGWQAVLNNNSFKPFSAINVWFTPAASRKATEDLYWSLRPLQITVPGQLHHGGFWVGKIIPPGQYRIEYHGIQDDISYAFVEILQLRAPLDGKESVQLIDVWKKVQTNKRKYILLRAHPNQMISMRPSTFIRGWMLPMQNKV
jgi:hypothetical protein